MSLHRFVNDTHREKLLFLRSVQKFIEIEAWLLLKFFICVHNQLSSIHSIAAYYRGQMFEKGDSV